MKKNDFTIISFYQFRQLENLLDLKKYFKNYCFFNKIKGTILLAPEGINGALVGLNKSIELFEKEILLKGFNNLKVKYSYNKHMVFNRLKIKIKKEIITFTRSNLDIENNSAIFINPENWNSLIDDKNTLILDLRNDFEHEVGTFKNSFNPKTKKFSEFKKIVDKKLLPKNYKNIAMFCTGGIRCEKASSYMLKKGYNNLYQLRGGILQYLEKMPKNKSRWKGECFVFDNRVSLKNELMPGTYKLCYGCRMPLSNREIKSDKYEEGVSCFRFYDSLSDLKKKKLKERNKQIKIARKKGIYNPYIKYTISNLL